MHKKILEGIDRDLNELKKLDKPAYKKTEKELEAVAEKTDHHVHKALSKYDVRKEDRCCFMITVMK